MYYILAYRIIIIHLRTYYIQLRDQVTFLFKIHQRNDTPRTFDVQWV